MDPEVFWTFRPNTCRNASFLAPLRSRGAENFWRRFRTSRSFRSLFMTKRFHGRGHGRVCGCLRTVSWTRTCQDSLLMHAHASLQRHHENHTRRQDTGSDEVLLDVIYCSDCLHPRLTLLYHYMKGTLAASLLHMCVVGLVF